ncbi:MAG: hypothetical protein J6K48_03270 [Lachnospiraceae bacterium]|nr:hypothetical protein [Lachnospiraceae bacterium]
MKNYITQETIDKLPRISIDGLLADENRFVNDWIKYTLQYAKDCNDSNEVGIMLDKSEWSNYDIVLGNEKSVKYNTDKMKKWLDEGNDNIILIHNHPSDNIFSDRDIFNFCKTDAINTLIVAGNKGSIYLLQKLNGFDKYKLIQYYSDAISDNKGRYSRRKILEFTLTTYESMLQIKFEKEVISC